MRKVILYIAASLDNYIARPDGNVDWLHDPENTLQDEDYGYKEFYESIDTTLMGYNTYREIEGFDVPFPYPDKTNYVFTRSPDHRDTEFVKFISGNIMDFVRDLKAKEGTDIWLIGGGQINTLMLNNQLIDKMILTLIPIVLGTGIPLFPGNSSEIKFRRTSGKCFENGVVQWTLDRTN
jgi:dihydrofolate reductase